MSWPSVLLAVVASAAPAAVLPNGDGDAEGWQRVLPGVELAYPADHGAHLDHRTEWWYLTGNVVDTSGRRFGFQLTVFRNGLDPDPPAPGASALRARHVYAGHLAVADVALGRTAFAERMRRASPLARAATDDLDLVLDDWSLRRDADGRLLASASDPVARIGLELELTPRKALVLHGDRGYSRKGAEPGNASAYASWTRLEVRGRLTSDGEARTVDGDAWFDHEHGSSVLAGGAVGWDWFGLHLDDGRDLMLFALRGADGAPVAVSAGTLIDVDGGARPLASTDFEINVRDTWRSPRTKAIYPAAWVLSIPAEGLRLEVTPVVPDAELATRSTGVVYWEGPVDVSGSHGGRGYAELTGYAGTMAGRF